MGHGRMLGKSTPTPVGFTGTAVASALVALALALCSPSLALGVVPSAPTPANTSAPSLTGTPAPGQTLTCATGSWSNNPSGYSYSWLRDGAPIAGQTGSTYVVQPADQGHSLSCRVTAGNSGGEYTIVGLASGSYKVSFYPRYGSGGNYLSQYFNGQATSAAATPVSVTAPNATSGINAALQAGGQITGKVTAESGGAPLAGIEVCAEQGELFGSCATTNAAGEYTISGLANGSYTVVFYPSEENESSANYLRKALPGSVSVTAPNTVSGINAALQTGGEITGKVTAESTALPIAKAFVSAFYEESGQTYFVGFAVTNAGGEYTIAGLATHPYKVEFYTYSFGEGEKNYLAQYYQGKSSSSTATPVSVVAGEAKSGIDAALKSGGEIVGTVKAQGGAALPNIYVCANEETGPKESAGSCGYTDSNGKYRIEGLPTGSKYVVEFSAGFAGGANFLSQYHAGVALMTEATSVPVTAGGAPTTINEEMKFPGGEISGRVTAASRGAPLKEIFVCADSTSSEVGSCGYTNSNGEYTVAALPAGSYTVYFEPFYESIYLSQTYAGSVLVTVSKVAANINAALQTGGQIAGRVTAASGGAGISSIACAYYSGR